LEGDGHLDIYKNNVRIWGAGRNGEHTRLNAPTPLPFKAPFKLCLLTNGDLVETDATYEAKKVFGTEVWQLYTGDKGKAPFEMRMQNDGNLVIYANELPIWARTWKRSCEHARQLYLAENKDVRDANQNPNWRLDPWDHYNEAVLKKAPGDKENGRQWKGAKCGTCEDAKGRYNWLYPDVQRVGMEPSRHYAAYGNREDRIWLAKGGKDACLPTLPPATKAPPPPATKAPPPPATKAPPPAVLPKCDRNNTNNIKYSSPETDSAGRKRFEGLKKGVRCLYPVDGTAIPTQDELYIHFDDEGGGSGGGSGGGTIELYQQCGGKGGSCASDGQCVDDKWSGKSCKSNNCKQYNEWHWQCEP
jgi:hypothetical protein